MNCPACTERLDVEKTINVAPGETDRVVKCNGCAKRFQTRESLTRELPAATRNHRKTPATTGEHGQTPATTGDHGRLPAPPGSPGAPPEAPGGKGGGVSGVLFPDPNPSSPGNPNRARAKSKPPAEYTPEWEREWRATAQTGSKRRAFKAWWRRGCPPLADAWAAWGKLDSWRRGFVPHVATWLNDDCHVQEPREVPKNGKAAVRAKVQEETTGAIAAADRQIAELRAAQARGWTPEERADWERMRQQKRHVHAVLDDGRTVDANDPPEDLRDDPMPAWAGGK